MNTSSILSIIGRERELFVDDWLAHKEYIRELASTARFLVVGGAGSIGGAVVRELFALSPRALHVIDVSENSLAELVRDLRSSLGYIPGDFQAYCFDGLGREFEALIATEERRGAKYDYILNFSALKHVRSEKDPFTLMRLIDVNIMLTRQLLDVAKAQHTRKFFCVSTDKAANPINMMGASKRIMEMFLHCEQGEACVSSARFANVAFSDGSLLHSWTQRLLKLQPIAAPADVRRYFMTSAEAAVLCLISVFLGCNHEILLPRLTPETHLTSFVDIAERFLSSQGYQSVACNSEEEARTTIETHVRNKRWPCYFFNSDTTGEKETEEFRTSSEDCKPNRFQDIEIVENSVWTSHEKLYAFLERIRFMRHSKYWSKQDLIDAFKHLLPDFSHHETGKYLDQRM